MDKRKAIGFIEDEIDLFFATAILKRHNQDGL